MLNGIIEAVNKAGGAWWDFSGSMLIQASILIMVLLVIDLAIRKHVRAVVRYVIWMLVLVKLVLPTNLALPTGAGYWMGGLELAKFQAPNAKSQTNTNFKTAKFQDGEISKQPAESISTEISNFQATNYKSQSTNFETAKIQNEKIKSQTGAEDSLKAFTWQGLLFMAWLAGVAALAIMVIQRIWFVRALVAQSKESNEKILTVLEDCRAKVGVRANVQLRLTSNMLSPAACGLMRPVILMPESVLANLSIQKLRAVLTHELVHIKRGDLWFNMIQTILQVVYFYNPLVWAANAIIRQVREQAVDETTLTKLGDEAKDYGTTLVDIAEMALARPHFSLRLVGVVESKKSLAGRIRHIMSRPIPKTAKIGFGALIGVVILGMVLLPMAKGQGSGERVEGTEKKQNFTTEGTKSTEKSLDNYKKTLANGVTVELIGICEYPGEGKQWWRPDGSNKTESIPLRSGPRQNPEPGQIARVMALTVGPNSNKPEISVRIPGCDGVTTWPGDNISGKQGSYIFEISFITSEKTSSVGVKAGIARSDWKNLVSRRGEGGGSSRYDNGKSVNFDATYEKNGLVCIPVAWESEPNLYAYRVVAVDSKGKIHEAVHKGNAWNKLASGTWKFAMAMQDVNQFVIQRRPYEWVEFKNVSLRPNKQSKISAEGGLGNSDKSQSGPDLTIATVEKRNAIMAKADGNIRLGLLRLAREFPFLKNGGAWDAILEAKSNVGGINIYWVNTNKGKTNVTRIVPEHEQFSVVVVIIESPKEPFQLAMFNMFPNLRLVGQVNTSAANPRLALELKNLVYESLQPLRDFNEKVNSSNFRNDPNYCTAGSQEAEAGQATNTQTEKSGTEGAETLMEPRGQQTEVAHPTGCDANSQGAGQQFVGGEMKKTITTEGTGNTPRPDLEPGFDIAGPWLSMINCNSQFCKDYAEAYSAGNGMEPNDAVLAKYKKFVDKYPNSPACVVILNLMAYNYEIRNKGWEAESSYARALEIAGKDRFANIIKLNLAHLYITERRYGEAQRICEEIATLPVLSQNLKDAYSVFPQMFNSKWHLAEIYSLHGQNTKADSLMRQTIDDGLKFMHEHPDLKYIPSYVAGTYSRWGEQLIDRRPPEFARAYAITDEYRTTIRGTTPSYGELIWGLDEVARRMGYDPNQFKQTKLIDSNSQIANPGH